MAGKTVDETAGRATTDMIDELREFADHLAVSGGDVARRMLGRFTTTGLDSRSKSSATDPVTVIDTSVEEHLRAEVAAARPGDRVLGEEGGEASTPGDAGSPRTPGDAGSVRTPGDAESVRTPGDAGSVRWVIDPVDGTVNLLYGIPFTAVSVAAEVDGVVVAGAVHNIVTLETWTAASGRGATLRYADGTESVIASSGCDELSLTLVGTGFAYDSGVRAEQGRVVADLLPRIRDIRRCGSAALDLCMVATGRLDAYYERCLKPWDHAAGALIASEAGAVVSVSTDDAVPTTAAAPGVAREFLEALGRAAAPGDS